MAGKASTVTVQILADADQYKREMAGVGKTTDKLGKDVGGSADTMGKKMSTFAKVAVAALAVQALSAVKDFVADSKRAFISLNESLNAVEVTFGSASAGIQKLGERAATSIGMSNAQFNGFAVSVSAFAQQIAGDSGDVVGVVDELTTRVADFASVMNLEMGEAQEKFQSGLAGESEPLRKFGIDVSAATVEAYALSAGIWDGTGAMTEAMKVQGRYGTIMEQTSKVQGDFANTATDLANAERIAAAQVENNKAVIGRAMEQLFKAGVPIMASFTGLLADMAVGFMELTGAISQAEGQFMRTQALIAGGLDELEAILVGASEEFRGSLWAENADAAEDFTAAIIASADGMGLTAEAAMGMRAEIEKTAQDLGWSTEKTDAAKDAFDRYIVTQDRAASDAGKHRGRFVELGSGIAEVGAEADEARTALEKFEEEVRSQTEPLFALLDAEDKVAAALAEVTAAQAEFGEGSPEWQQATRDLALANEALIAAQLKVAEQSGFTRDEFNTHLQQMGNMTQEQIEFILGQFDRANQYNWREQVVNVKVRGVDVPMGFGLPRAHSGGVIAGPRGREVPIIAQAGETILPLDHKNGNGGGTVINLSVTSLDPQAAGRAVVEALQSWQRSNGALPITVRSA